MFNSYHLGRTSHKPEPFPTHHQWTALILCLSSAGASACPPGTALQQGIGWQGCAPMAGTTSSTLSRSEPEIWWADRWGAIAVDTARHGSIGFTAVTGMEQKGRAEKAALKSCRDKGGSRCEIKIAYRNQCTALTWGDRSFNTSSAASEAEAKQVGMDKCTQAGERNCETFYSGCSAPVRVR